MEVKNYMETVVENVLDDIIHTYPEFCNCKQCRKDVQALALNHLTPHYISSYTGQVYVKCMLLNQHEMVRIITEVTKAVLQVMQNPSHSTAGKV